MLKTHSCGTLSQNHKGQQVTLAGWVHRRRDHGGLIFVDLRDSKGIVQIVFNPAKSLSLHSLAETIRNEWVVQIDGTVAIRPEGTKNPDLPTGEVEVEATSLTVLNESSTPPFEINELDPIDENLRLRYRYLDLRRTQMSENITLRHQVARFIREFLYNRGFIEVETPILIKSTPEGARDYLVPSRIYPGSFFALPQSPQQLKQLLMVGGIERYFQIAKCFRDEDQRADRQPEFTQLDLEMAFVDSNDVLNLMEDLYRTLTAALAPQKRVLTPIPRLTYQQAMGTYGSDKPDLRYGLKLVELGELLTGTQFIPFQKALQTAGVIKGFTAPKMAHATRKERDHFLDEAKRFGLGGLITISINTEASSIEEMQEDQFRSSGGPNLPKTEIQQIATQMGSGPGDLLFIAAGPRELVEPALGYLRQMAAATLNLASEDELAYVFITDFPLLRWVEEEKRWHAVHHPFTSPRHSDTPNLEINPGAVISQAYDLACNGSELAGGSIRINTRALQERIFDVMGLSREVAQSEFGHLLEAFDYGAPPHGGFAGGIDRLVVLLSNNAQSIRDVIAFPKNQSAVDLLFNAPGPVSNQQLKDVHLKGL